MDDPVETIELEDLTVKIYQDDFPESPREWSNLGHMICHHPRYNFGDEQFNPNTVANSVKEFEQYLETERDAYIMLPLYIYDHSGVTMTARSERASMYPDRQWDVSHVGYIYITAAKIKEEYSVKRISKQLRERVTEYLMGEVDTYDKYLQGDVWGYVIEDSDGNDLDSCWGLFEFEYAKKEAMGIAEGIINKRKEEAVT